MDFAKKLSILNKELTPCIGNKAEPGTLYLEDKSKLMSLTVMAIISDLADEQFHFRASSWKEGLDSQMIRSRLNNLDSLRDHVFPELSSLSSPEERVASVIGDVLLEIGTHIMIMIRSHSTGFWDKILPGRRATVVTKATNQLWDEIVLAHFFGYSVATMSSNGSSRFPFG